MPLGTNHVTTTRAATAIPELWSDELVADYKINLVMPRLVTYMNHVGKRGDTVRVPAPVRGDASPKDICRAPAGALQISFYTRDAGYALARQVDTSLVEEGELFNGGTSGSNWTSGVTNTGAATAIEDFDPAALGNQGNNATAQIGDLAIRGMIQHLDENDVPFLDRFFVVPPAVKANLLGVERFSEEARVGERAGENSIRSGLVKDVYGVEVYVSNNVPRFDTDDNVTFHRASLMFGRDAIVFAEQVRPRVQMQYVQQYLATLLTADAVWGTLCIRPEAGIAFISRDT